MNLKNRNKLLILILCILCNYWSISQDSSNADSIGGYYFENNNELVSMNRNYFSGSTSFAGYVKSDTSTPIPNEQLHEAVRLIEIGKKDSAIIVKQDSIISQQKDLISSKVSQISGLNAKVKSYDLLVTSYQNQIKQLNKAGLVSDDWIKVLRKEVKQQRTEKVIVGILGILGIGGTVYLLAK